MAYKTLSDTGSELKDILNFPNLDTPLFYPFIIWGLFLILSFGSYFAEKQRTGKGNIFSSFAVSGVIFLIGASLLMRSLEMISQDFFIVNIIIGIISVVLYLISNRE